MPSKSARLGGAAAGVVWLLLLAVAARAGEAPKRVTIEAMKFEPQSISVQRGETVIFINKDPFPHTVTSGGFDSKEIAPNATWVYRAEKRGEFNYHCTLHPVMTGQVSVR